MEEISVVHVHRIDEESVIQEHLTRGYVLKDKATPSIVTQGGFYKLTFTKNPEIATRVLSGEIEIEVPDIPALGDRPNWKRLFSFK